MSWYFPTWQRAVGNLQDLPNMQFNHFPVIIYFFNSPKQHDIPILTLYKVNDMNNSDGKLESYFHVLHFPHFLLEWLIKCLYFHKKHLN